MCSLRNKTDNILEFIFYIVLIIITLSILIRGNNLIFNSDSILERSDKITIIGDSYKKDNNQNCYSNLKLDSGIVVEKETIICYKNGTSMNNPYKVSLSFIDIITIVLAIILDCIIVASGGILLV